MARATNILLVDDDDIDVMGVRRALDKAKIDDLLFHAADGLAALEMLRDGSVPARRRLVLLDLSMPRMSGVEFLRELRADPALRGTPVVVLTTSDQERDVGEAYALNVAGYVVKPIQSAALVEIVAAMSRYWGLMEMP
jgi:CheY-like chemotaxis protein